MGKSSQRQSTRYCVSLRIAENPIIHAQVQEETLNQLSRDVAQADRLRARADELLTQTVRAAARAGYSQREIANATGRSQPEVSRLIRFRGTSPLAKRLRRSRAGVFAIAKQFGLQHLEVFGSVARGTDHEQSDIDLLYTSRHPQTLFTLAAAEAAMSKLLGAHVDLIDRNTLKPHVSETALNEAIPL